MKVVILAGGLGTRISEESHLKPKPMIEIGGRPILWHIMKYYSEFGFHDFVICLGYKQYVVKEFFADYFLHTSDVTFDLANNRMEVHNNYAEPWKVTLVDTGLNTMTGGRVKRIQPYIGDEPFMLTYGDGVCNVDLKGLVEFHKSHGKTATITTVSIDQQKGVLDIGPDNTIRSFFDQSLHSVRHCHLIVHIHKNQILVHRNSHIFMCFQKPLISASCNIIRLISSKQCKMTHSLPQHDTGQFFTCFLIPIIHKWDFLIP